MSIFGRFTHADALEKKQKVLRKLIKEYEELLKIAVDQATVLYNNRKNAYDKIAALRQYVHGLEESPDILVKGMDRALGFAEVMKEARDNELDGMGSGIHASKKFSAGTKGVFSQVGIGMAAAGGAKALGGPAALMAIATTFGTASTGTAISTLGGAAAVNAAMAWIGGGAVAAGGTGMAGGALVLGALGPIGLSLAAVGLAASVISATKNRSDNDRKIQEVERLIKDVDNGKERMMKVIRDVNSMISITKKLTRSVDRSAMPILPANFANNRYPQTQLISMVDDAKTLGKLTRESISIAI